MGHLGLGAQGQSIILFLLKSKTGAIPQGRHLTLEMHGQASTPITVFDILGIIWALLFSRTIGDVL